MARAGRGPLRTPPWLVGPCLVVPPVFLAMFVAVAPRPVPPVLAQPRLERVEADRELQSLLARERGARLDEEQRGLLGFWEAYSSRRLLRHRTGGQAEAVNVAQLRFGRACHKMATSGRVADALAVGDVLAARLVRALARLEGEDAEAEGTVLAVGGTYLYHARDAGLVDRGGRLQVHPLVAAVAFEMGFRAECGMPGEAGLTPVEQAAIDVVRLRFGPRLPPQVRAEAALRFSRHDPGYPSAASAAAILLEGGELREAYELLAEAVAASPGDRALRNNLLYASEALVEGL